ncbi:MAG: ATP-binding protein [Bacteroidota bacterium]
MVPKLKILHLEGIPRDAELIRTVLESAGLAFEKKDVTDKQGYIDALTIFGPDVILSAYHINGFSAPEALSISRAGGLTAPFLLVTASDQEELAIAALENGAADYILKDRLLRLPYAINNAFERIKPQTERFQKEALRKSEANLSAVIENTNDLVYSLDKDLKFITFNNRFKTTVKQVYGLDVMQGIYSLDLLSSYHPDFAAKWEKIYHKTLSGETQQFINEYPVGDGVVYLSYSVNPIWESGQVIGLSVFSRDITRQRADEVALVKSEANLRSVFENTDLAIILYNTELEMVSYNSNAARQSVKIFGKKLKPGRSALSYFPKSRWPVILQVIERVKKQEVVTYEAIYDAKGGGKEWFEAKWAGVFNQRHEMVSVILSLKNITENKNADIEREKMTADLISRNQDLEQFTYIISHNLRAPVANIKGLSQLLHVDIPDEDSKETLQALSLSVNQLDKVIIDLNQMLQVNKQVNEHKEKVILNELVEEIKLETGLIMAKNKVAIHCDFAAVPQIFTIRGYLYSIFQNLITNSIKYRRNDADPVIYIKTTSVPGHIAIVFEDNGKGIDLVKNGAHLFGLYKRFDFSVEGKGMGLFMVRKQVQSLGGTIDVQSQPAFGTRFMIDLPL